MDFYINHAYFSSGVQTINLSKKIVHSIVGSYIIGVGNAKSLHGDWELYIQLSYLNKMQTKTSDNRKTRQNKVYCMLPWAFVSKEIPLDSVSQINKT